MKRGKIGRGDKHGLSEIVVTLIMIVLVLVAISIVWFIVRGILDKGTGQVNLGTDCLEVQVSAISFKNTTDNNNNVENYDVVLTRSAGGGDLGGVKIIFNNATGSSNYVHTVVGNIAPLETKTISATSVSIDEANKVEIAPYFTDDSGNEQVCSTSTSFDF